MYGKQDRKNDKIEEQKNGGARSGSTVKYTKTR